MKIYVVMKNDGCECSVITATFDENLADAIAKKFDDAYVDVHENPENLLKPCWFVRFEKDGSVCEIKNKTSDAYWYQDINKCSFDTQGRVYVAVNADDSIAAIEIAAEKRSRFLAEKKPPLEERIEQAKKAQENQSAKEIWHGMDTEDYMK